MLFQVTEIKFDFTTDDGEYELQPSKQEQIIDETIGQIWEADDEDDLVEEITCATGWCIKSIDYRYILKWELFFSSLHFSLVFSSVLMLSQPWMSIKNNAQNNSVTLILISANDPQKFNTQITV